MVDWLQAVWTGRPRLSLRKLGMFVLDGFKCYLTLNARIVIDELVVITGDITS
jgi:hypothetical protein